MIEYLLLIQVCTSILSEGCAWLPSDRFATEEQCVAHGLGSRFQCVRRVYIPLPRPRP
jgi:hypothetical protein